MSKIDLFFVFLLLLTITTVNIYYHNMDEKRIHDEAYTEGWIKGWSDHKDFIEIQQVYEENLPTKYVSKHSTSLLIDHTNPKI